MPLRRPAASRPRKRTRGQRPRTGRMAAHCSGVNRRCAVQTAVGEKRASWVAGVRAEGGCGRDGRDAGTRHRWAEWTRASTREDSSDRRSRLGKPSDDEDGCIGSFDVRSREPSSKLTSTTYAVEVARVTTGRRVATALVVLCVSVRARPWPRRAGRRVDCRRPGPALQDRPRHLHPSHFLAGPRHAGLLRPGPPDDVRVREAGGGAVVPGGVEAGSGLRHLLLGRGVGMGVVPERTDVAGRVAPRVRGRQEGDVAPSSVRRRSSAT